MKIHIYCPKISESAKVLTKALGAQRLRKFDGESFWNKGKRISLDSGNVVVCWGSYLPSLDNLRILNSNPKSVWKKFSIFTALAKSGILTPRIVDPSEVYNPRDYTAAGYVPVEGKDGAIIYWEERPQYSEVLRIHSFNGKSIRAGKIVNEEAQYGDYKSSSSIREAAHKAIKALGLVFGAVDLGLRSDNGRLLVTNIETAPALEGLTLNAYVRAINRWASTPEEVQKPIYNPVEIF